jgi:hypothetical protein
MAVNFSELKEQLTQSFKNSWEQFQESSLYNQIKDRFENLSPTGQKLVMVLGAFLLVFMVMSFPWGFYSQSSSYIGEFESKRDLIRDLLKVSREVQSGPNIPIPPPMDALQSKIQSLIQQSQFIPEQVRGIEMLSENSNLIPADLSQGLFKVTLAKLNLRQIIDFGFQLQSQSASIKMKDLLITANGQDPRYLDVTYKLLVLKVPEFQMPIPEPEEPKAPRKKTKKDEE